MSVAAFHARRAIHGSIRSQVLRETEQQLAAQIRMRDFASAELHHRFHTIAILQKANSVVLLEIVIVIVGVRTELQFLHLHHVLFFFASCCFFFISY